MIMAKNVLEHRMNLDDPGGGQYAPINGLNLYYETYGSGPPLVLLHGGFGVIRQMFGHLIPLLAAQRQVIAVELQGHGHTGDIDRPLRFEAMADDIAGLLGHLGLEQADVCGYSLGGGVALQTAIRHPAMVSKLVLISAPARRQGWYPETLAGMAAVNGTVAATWVGSPMHEAYAAVAPNVDDWPTLADKLNELLGREYDWSAQVGALPMPVLIVVGDADAVRTSHAVEMFGLLGGGQQPAGLGVPLPQGRLAILPGTTHYDLIFRTDLLLPILTTFLAATPASDTLEPPV
jgi:pimeloyl-ACP methyl ester carboxylesterase